MFCYSTKLQIRAFCLRRQSSFARRRSFRLHASKQEEQHCQCSNNNERYQLHELESISLSSKKTKFVIGEKEPCTRSTSVQQAITRGCQLERQLLHYFASSSQKLSSLHAHSSSEQLEQSVNSLLPITGTALAWQMHTAFEADAITRPMLFPQRAQHTYTMHHTTPNQEQSSFDAQNTNSNTQASIDNTISDTTGEPSQNKERIVNLNAILRSALHRTSASGPTYATLRESGEYRMLDSRFTNKPEQGKDLTNAEVPFVKLSHDLQRIWYNAITAHASIGSLYKLLSSSSSSVVVTFPPYQSSSPNCVAFLILYAHQRHSCAVTSHMIDIANMIKKLVNGNNFTGCKTSNRKWNVKSSTFWNENNNKGTNISFSTPSTVCADNVLKVITIAIGFEPPPLSSMPCTENLHSMRVSVEENKPTEIQNERRTCEHKQNNQHNENTMHYEEEEVEDTLCYSHAGAYTLNGILHIIQSLSSYHDNKRGRNKRLETEQMEDNLQKRVFILSESWLTPRTLNALHSSSHASLQNEETICEKAKRSKLTNYENSNSTEKMVDGYNIHKHVEFMKKNNNDDNNNTVIEVIPSVISNSLSEVEKNAIARYIFCRMLN